MNSAASWTVISRLFLTQKRRHEDNRGLQKAPQGSLRAGLFSQVGESLKGNRVEGRAIGFWLHRDAEEMAAVGGSH